MKYDTPILKRSIGFWLLLFYGLGNILGAGIYVLIGKIAGIAGYHMPLSFILACIIVLFTALSYAELSARFPRSAGAAIYIYEGFKSPKLSTLFGLVIALTGLLSAATLLHGFYGYLNTFFDFPKTITIVTLIILLSSIAIWGVSESLVTTAIFTIIEIIGLLIVIIVGLPYVEFDLSLLANYVSAIDISNIHYYQWCTYPTYHGITYILWYGK